MTTSRVELPTITPYGQYSSGNYGVNTLRLDIGSLRVWYSYTTIVAFYVLGDRLSVCQNGWGPTTGKHLNWIDGGGTAKKDRIPNGQFNKELERAIRRTQRAPRRSKAA